VNTLSPAMARALERRRPLAVDPRRSVAIKRNAHEFVVAAGPSVLAHAFAAVMREQDRFADLCILRHPARAGQPFEKGERFVASFRRLGWRWLEDRVLSDSAEIVETEPTRVTYRYLEGSPIAGESSYAILPDGAGSARVVVTFTFQEQGGLALSALHRFGIRWHDRVVQAQVEAAAKKIGARVLESTLRA